MNEILISIIMPVFNAADYLVEAVNSILNQTYTNFELIIIDDGSIDCSSEIIRTYKDNRIRAFHFNNGGCSKQRNFGISVACGELIALMDADDISEPTRIEAQLEFLKSNQEIGVLGTNCLIMDENGKTISNRMYPEFHDEIEFVAPIIGPMCFPTMMAYKKTILDVGGYQEKLLAAGDHDLLLRLLSNGHKIHNYQTCLYKRRICKNSITFTKGEMQQVNHYNSSVIYLENSYKSGNERFYDYRRGLLEYYFGNISNARCFLRMAYRNKLAPRSKLARLILTSLLGNAIIKFLRRKNILSSINNLVFRLFKYDLQKVKFKN